ncbi:hypothetical protein Glove_85g135 [Diversispora epigaea]|uniref:Uncharacterized protein n=1 Tax=Diversispora epigaea TaxID=1348612 RepID=A0A397JBF2_9GLOM|nr:hypothetical protein Glove_85g135 [Diversispora epigaea]
MITGSATNRNYTIGINPTAIYDKLSSTYLTNPQRQPVDTVNNEQDEGLSSQEQQRRNYKQNNTENQNVPGDSSSFEIADLVLAEETVSIHPQDITEFIPNNDEIVEADLDNNNFNINNFGDNNDINNNNDNDEDDNNDDNNDDNDNNNGDKVTTMMMTIIMNNNDNNDTPIAHMTLL